MGEDFIVACGSWFNDFPRQHVGVDYGEGIGWLGEDRGDGGFAGRDGPCET